MKNVKFLSVLIFVALGTFFTISYFNATIVDEEDNVSMKTDSLENAVAMNENTVSCASVESVKDFYALTKSVDKDETQVVRVYSEEYQCIYKIVRLHKSPEYVIQTEEGFVIEDEIDGI